MSQDQAKADKPASLPLPAHFICGWPLVLVLFGGAIGGGLGGIAYAVNIAVYQSRLPLPLKVVLNLAAGGAAIALWLAIGLIIQSTMSQSG